MNTLTFSPSIPLTLTKHSTNGPYTQRQYQAFRSKAMYLTTQTPHLAKKRPDNLEKVGIISPSTSKFVYCKTYLKTKIEHLNHFQQVFDYLCKTNIKLKLTKCDFFKAQLHYLDIYSHKMEHHPYQKI